MGKEFDNNNKLDSSVLGIQISEIFVESQELTKGL